MKSKTLIPTVFDQDLFGRPTRSLKEMDVIFSPSVVVKSTLRFDPKHTDVRAKSYYTIVSHKLLSQNSDEYAWSEWNQILLMIIHRHSDFFACQVHSISSIERILDEIPGGYSIRSRLKNLGAEVGVERTAPVSVKSLFSMLRFLPILEEKSDDLIFDLDDETGRFCVSLAAQIAYDSKKTLDLVFTDDGEVLFTFIEGGQGFSRISGSSYLTDYLVNSSKFRKLINIFDY